MTNQKDALAANVRKVLAADAKTSPTAVFEHPNNVVSEERLTKKEKTGILAQWESDAKSLQTATDEGMSGEGHPRLDEVKSAQSLLDSNAPVISAVPPIMTLINTFKVSPDKADSLVAALIDAIGHAMRPQRGFISASVHKTMDGTRVVNYAQWANKTDFDKMSEDPLAKDHMARCAAIAKSVEPIFYEVVYSK